MLCVCEVVCAVKCDGVCNVVCYGMCDDVSGEWCCVWWCSGCCLGGMVDFMLFWGFADWRMDICTSWVAFATEKSFLGSQLKTRERKM